MAPLAINPHLYLQRGTKTLLHMIRTEQPSAFGPVRELKTLSNPGQNLRVPASLTDGVEDHGSMGTAL